jgi:DNA-binding protein HU-beta
MSESTGAPAKKGKGERKSRDEKFFKRTDLAASVADKTGLPRPKALHAVEAVLDVVIERLKAGQEVRLVGFGAFIVAERKAGKGRDPRTGAEIDIPESKSVRFRPSKVLRDAVSGKTTDAAAETE